MKLEELVYVSCILYHVFQVNISQGWMTGEKALLGSSITVSGVPSTIVRH